jgi:hypothetical protein
VPRQPVRQSHRFGRQHGQHVGRQRLTAS